MIVKRALIGAIRLYQRLISPGLPPAAQAVAAARPPGVVTLQEGDVTLFTRTVRLDEAR